VFEVDERYECQRIVGVGAFGTVCAALDTITGEEVAIKKINNATENLQEAQQTIRELRILKGLCHDNIIAIKDVLRPADSQIQDIYIVTKLMDMDLRKAFKTLYVSGEHIRTLTYQVRGDYVL
jgi:serine/threonine protein kinase